MYLFIIYEINIFIFHVPFLPFLDSSLSGEVPNLSVSGLEVPSTNASNSSFSSATPFSFLTF